jgi:hypothetical protein
MMKHHTILLLAVAEGGGGEDVRYPAYVDPLDLLSQLV